MCRSPVYDGERHPGRSLRICQFFASGCQIVQRRAGEHGAELGEELDTADVAPFAFGNGVEPENLSCLAFGLLEGGNGAGLVFVITVS